MVIMPNNYGQREPIIIKPGSLACIYVTASVEAEFLIIDQNRKMQEEENKIASKVNAFKDLLALPIMGDPS